VIENNKYGMGTSSKRHAAGELYRRGEGYGIPGEQVDGMDVIAVRDAARQALDYVRGGNGPYILEMMTYRYRGHSMSDPAKYRSKEEVEKMKEERDPIQRLKNRMEKAGITEDDLKDIEKEVKLIVNESAQFAQESAEPDAAELWTDVLIEVKD
jgi:pyruvate dehydrogenase E1 component alpha subunit